MPGMLDSKEQLHDFYKAQLNDCVSFWIRHGLDEQYGGYNTFLNRAGSPYSYWKYTWCQGRAAYQFAKLCNTLERRPEWLHAAKLGVDFIKSHVLKGDNRVYSKLSREGKPVAWQPEQIFPECFVILGLAEWAKAGHDEEALGIADRMFWNNVRLMESGELAALSSTVVPYYKWHGPEMIMLNVAQELREITSQPELDPLIGRWVEEELFQYTKEEYRIMFERLKLDNSVDMLSHEGRSVTPGHVLESAWFCLREGLERENRRIIDRACTLVEWGMEKGWDPEYGGLFNFVDYKGGPHGHHDEGWGEDQDWDAKIFWTHAEALYAVLLAHQASKREGLAKWYEDLHRWTFEHFPDPEYGEWFGYLRRDGTRSQNLKGGIKGFFHIPRALLNCVILLGSDQKGTPSRRR
jgi:N-acylglucosamine 2-epimerase